MGWIFQDNQRNPCIHHSDFHLILNVGSKFLVLSSVKVWHTFSSSHRVRKNLPSSNNSHYFLLLIRDNIPSYHTDLLGK